MPHQSFIVNLKYVKDVKNYELLMVNGDRIPLFSKKSCFIQGCIEHLLKENAHSLEEYIQWILLYTILFL